MKKQFKFLMVLMLIIAMGKTNFGQQANIWYFGHNAGLDFNGGPPVAITSGALVTDEGCASICDNTGALLFYTDGRYIWDNTHTIINPGSPLRGHPSSTQSAVIVPKPGSATRYYIFTQDAQGLGACTVGMYYSEVDVTGSTVTLVVANTFLYGCSATTEKVTIACHANGTDYWALTVLQNGDFVSWPVTSAGVGTAIISAGMASADIGTDDRVGYMKVSRQGDHIVLGRRQWNSVNEAFDFDNSTGVVTANLGTYHTGTVYGVEFSSNGSYFYTTENFNKVVQYDFSFTATTVFNSPPGTSNDVGALQLGPDGNIYVANGYEGNNGFFIDMISNVNTATPTYNDNYISLPPGTYSRLGLPDVVACFVPNEDCKVESNFHFVFNPQNCSYDFIDMSTHGTGTNIVAWEWTFGDGTSSTQQNPTHFYSAPGVYTVCLTVTGFDGEKCCVSQFCTQVIVQQVCNEPCRVEPMFVISMDACHPCQYNFHGFTTYANREIVAWLWDFGDGTTATGQDASHIYSMPGVYMVCLKVIARGANGECCVFEFCQPVQVNCGTSGGGGGTNPPAEANPAQGMTSGTANYALQAYPNPASSNLHVEFNAPANQKVNMQLVDYTGKIVWESNERSATKGKTMKEIDISNISTGIYLLRIESETLKLTEKIQIVKD